MQSALAIATSELSEEKNPHQNAIDSAGAYVGFQLAHTQCSPFMGSAVSSSLKICDSMLVATLVGYGKTFSQYNHVFPLDLEIPFATCLRQNLLYSMSILAKVLGFFVSFKSD